MKKTFENEFTKVECEIISGDLFISFFGQTKKIESSSQLKSFLSLVSTDLYLQIFDEYFNQFGG